MGIGDQAEDFKQLHALIAEAEDVKGFLGVALELGQDAAAVLNYFGPTAGLFTKYAVQDGVVFANMAGHALRLALRMAAADQLADNLKAAMESRTAINLACGILMEQNQCSQGQAIDILRRASSARNQKLHVLAQALIASFSGAEQITTYFDD